MVATLVPIVVCTSMFAMVFGIVYLKSRENMALIEKGINPKIRNLSPRPFRNLRWGLMLIGAGVGLLMAFILDNTILKHNKKSVEKKVVRYISDTSSNDTNKSKQRYCETNLDNKQSNDLNINGECFDEDDSINTHISGKMMVIKKSSGNDDENQPIYFALIGIGGGLGLFFSYKIEKKEWLDKKNNSENI